VDAFRNGMISAVEVDSARTCEDPAMAGIDDWDRVAASVLQEKGQAGLPELVEGVGIEQFDERMAKAWVNDALSRGLIRSVDGSRYELTDKGSARLA
jgi:hypothetical protein